MFETEPISATIRKDQKAAIEVYATRNRTSVSEGLRRLLDISLEAVGLLHPVEDTDPITNHYVATHSEAESR